MLALASSISKGPAGETGAAAATNAPVPAPRRTFDVRGYHVSGNTVMPPGKIDALLTNYTGSAVDLAQVRQGARELQLLYRNLGFVTVAVTLPQQKLTNGIVLVNVVEGRLSKITISGNRYFSSNNISRTLPSLGTNEVLNTKWLQPELDRANANPDRQIYPVLSPGVDPGTTDLSLMVKDRLPLHGHIELNDKSTPETPLLRVDSAIQYNNLWQREHQVGLQYNFSPQSFKPDDANAHFPEGPAVVSYSGFYRLPLTSGRSLRDVYDRMPVDFGYDQVTHRFNLPQPTGSPELIVYASRSSTDTGSRLGPINTLTNTATLDVFTRMAERDPSETGNAGFKFLLPLPRWGDLQSSLNFGWDYKSFESRTLLTNYPTVEQFNTNGSPQYSETLTNPQNSAASLNYMPLSVGWTGARPDRWGRTSFTLNDSVFVGALASARTNFQVVAGSPSAGGNYFVLNAGLTREQKLPAEWSILFRANGQWSSAPLIGNEQFALGGTSGVRGYEEGENYGDAGWRALFDLRAPPVNIGYLPDAHGETPVDLRCSWFMDYGESYLKARKPAAASTIEEWGTGLGFYVTAGPHVDARLAVAWALRDTPLTRAGDTRAYFSVGYQF
jgi:hemolysin activation/secretion protein